MAKYMYAFIIATLLFSMPNFGYGSERVSGPRGLLGDTCDPYNGGLISGVFRKKRVQESNKTWNISRAFINGVTTTSKTFTTSWAGKMSCSYGTLGDHIYFFSGLNGSPFYVIYQDNNTALTYWIKFVVTVESSKSGVNGLGGTHSISSYQTSYTVTATLLTSQPADLTASNSKQVTSGVMNLVPAVSSGHGGADTGIGIINRTTYGQKALNYMISGTAASAWDTDNFLTFETLSVTYSPSQTTCEVQGDITVTLPPASYARLVNNGSAPGKFIAVPIECGNESSVSTSTRKISAWLSSHDLITSGTTGTTMANDESSAEGVGIALRDHLGSVVTLSNGYVRGDGTTELFEIAKGEKLDSDYTLYMEAFYQVYDKSSLRPGTIVATAQVMFTYD